MNYLYQLTSQVYLDSLDKCYKKVIVINQQPDGPLKKLTKLLSPPPLSPFQVPSDCCASSLCVYAILDPLNNGQLLCMNNIANLFSFLVANNYTIDTSITKIMMKTTEKINKLICYIGYKN